MNEMFLPMQVSSTALEAQKIRLNVIASNIANASSTKTPEGGLIGVKTSFSRLSCSENLQAASKFRKLSRTSHPSGQYTIRAIPMPTIRDMFLIRISMF